MNRNNIRISKCIQVLFLSLAGLLFFACDDVNTIHQEYYDRGEGIYTGSVDSLKFQVGYEKVRFNWEINADPRIAEILIYWDERADSVVLEVNRTEDARLQMSYLMEEIAEDSYVFEFLTTDGMGHYSLSTEIAVEVLGESYISSLRGRAISSLAQQEDGSWLITWEPIASSNLQHTTLEYVQGGETQTVIVENGTTETVLTGLAVGDELSVFSTFLPENAFETFDSPRETYSLE